MAKKKAEKILSIPVGNYFNRQDVEIWNDICSVKSDGPYHVMIKRDNGESINLRYKDEERIDMIKAVALAVLGGRNYER